MQYKPAPSTDAKKICDGQLSFEGIAPAAAHVVATWNLAEGQKQMSEKVIATLKTDKSLASSVSGIGDLFYTLGEARQEGQFSVVPYSVWFAGTTS